MKSYTHLLFITISFLSLSTLAQTSKKTLNYQAVILDPKAIDIPGASITGQPLNKGNVCLRFSLLNATGGLDYEETQQVTTDEFGLVSVNIGVGTQGSSNSIYKSFESVVWNSSVKSLKVSVSYDGCSSFKQVSTQVFNYTPYALYAEAVDYKNVREAPTKLSQFANDAGFLIPKDLDPLKSDIKTNSSQIATANKTIADNKQASDATFLVMNQSITSLDTQVAANTTAIKETSNSIGTINSKLSDQQNQIVDNRNQISATNNTMNAQIGGLQGQLNTTNSTVSNLTGAAEVVSNKSTSVNLGGANPSDQLYPSQKAAKAYVDQVVSQIATSGVPDATTLAAGKLQLAGDLGGTATSPTVPALANKENSSNKSTATDLGAGNPSDQLYPSQKATKAYVDNSIYAAVGSGVPDATTNAAGKVKLAGDLAGTAAIPLVAKIQGSPVSSTTPTTGQVLTYNGTSWAPAAAGSSNKEDVSNKSNAALGTSTTLYPTQNAVKTYVDAQVASATIVDADATTRGKIQLAGDLAGTAALPTVPGLLLKEDVSNKSNAALGTSATLYPTQNAVKTYVDAQVASGAPDATSLVKGKIALSGDLAGTNSSASTPVISDNAITSDKIANLAVIDAKIAGVAGSKVSGNITGNAANVTGTVGVANGGTGSSTLTVNNVLLGNGASALQVVAPGATGNVLTSNGTTWSSSAPQNLANTISGVVPVANGGTGLSSLTNSGAVYASSNSALTTGTLPITAGGTGAISANAAFNAIAPTQISNSGKYLTTDGTNTSWGTVASTLPTTVNTSANYNIVMATGQNLALVTGTGNGGTAATLNPYTGQMNISGITAQGYGVTSPFYASAPQVLTDAATISWNPANGLNASVTLGGNRTLSFSSTPASGSYGTLVITQDATGGRTLTLPSTANKVLGSTSTTSIALSTASGAKDILNFYYDGTTYFWNIGQGYGTASTASTTNLASSVTGTLAVGNGGTGATTLTGLVKGTGTSAMIAAVAGTDYSAGTSALGTGILKSTTSTGALTIATASDFPTLNQSTTGNAANVTGTVAVANGGTGATTLTANNVLLGNGTSAFQVVAPGASGNVLTSNGTTWSSTTPAASGVPYSGATSSVNLGAYNLTVNSLTIGQGGRSSNNNTAIGIGVLPSTTSGSNNTGLGSSALAANTGDNNVGIGFQALKLNTSGGNNIAIGQNAANSNLTGSNNVAIGFQTAFWATSDNITAVGSMALNAEKGAGNTALGVGAGKVGSGGPYSNTTNSTFLGYNTTTGKTTDVTITNATAIGYGATVTASNNIQLGNTTVTNVNTSGALTTGTVTYPIVHGTANQVLTTTGSGTLTFTTPTVSKPISDQFTATAAQTSFTLSQTPITNTTVSPNVKPNVWMYINGIRTNNIAYTISGTTVTYYATSNNNYTIVVGDRIQFDYTY